MTTLYLDLIQKCLLNTIYEDAPFDWWSGNKYQLERRVAGEDWPSQAHTMIGWRRLHQLRQACEIVIQEGIDGDFIEAGVWRGGACIMMRAVLKAYGITNRTIWCADSFEGLPKPDDKCYPADCDDRHYTYPQLSVTLENVRNHFAKYDLLDGQVVFLKGWFKDTLSTAPINKLAVLRLDGDMYESTIQALDALYPRVSPNGFVIVDDYGVLAGCRTAVNDYRSAHHISEPMQSIDRR